MEKKQMKKGVVRAIVIAASLITQLVIFVMKKVPCVAFMDTSPVCWPLLFGMVISVVLVRLPANKKSLQTILSIIGLVIGVGVLVWLIKAHPWQVHWTKTYGIFSLAGVPAGFGVSQYCMDRLYEDMPVPISMNILAAVVEIMMMLELLAMAGGLTNFLSWTYLAVKVICAASVILIFFKKYQK